MMNFEKHRYEVLCEDQQMACFVRYFLIAHGANPRKIFVWDLPMQGCGEQYVREKYPQLLQTMRSRNYEKNWIGIVCTDADTRTVQERIGKLKDQCEAAEIQSRSGETVMMFIPKRNIETWIRWYEGKRDTNESEDYGHFYRNRESDCKPAAVAMAQNFRSGVFPDGTLGSVVLAYEEYRRLLRVQK